MKNKVKPLYEDRLDELLDTLTDNEVLMLCAYRVRHLARNQDSSMFTGEAKALVDRVCDASKRLVRDWKLGK